MSKKLASASAHKILAKLIELDQHPTGEDEATATSEDGIKVKVSIGRSSATPPAAHDLSEIEQIILEAATSKPVTIKKLAALAGYAYTKHFRDAVNSLIDAGQLVRTRCGVRSK